MIRNDNLIMTYASGKKFFEENEIFWVYVESFKRNLQNTDCVMLTHDMPQDVRNRLEDYGVIVEDFPEEKMMYIYRDRHLAFWNYLNNHGHKYRYIFVSDCKDVMFQSSPFDWADQWKTRFNDIKGNKDFLNHFVILVSEGFKSSRCGFSRIEHFEFERDVQLPFLQKDTDRWVVNGGTMMGTPKALQEFHFLIWITTMKSIGRITDQATLNWLLYHIDQDDTYSISHPQHDNLCLTGEGIKEGGVEPILIGGKLYNPKKQLYCVLHQWERLDHLKETILSQYLT